MPARGTHRESYGGIRIVQVTARTSGASDCRQLSGRRLRAGLGTRPAGADGEGGVVNRGLLRRRKRHLIMKNDQSSACYAVDAASKSSTSPLSYSIVSIPYLPLLSIVPECLCIIPVVTLHFLHGVLVSSQSLGVLLLRCIPSHK